MILGTAQFPAETTAVGILHQSNGMRADAGCASLWADNLVMKKRYILWELYRFLLCYCEFLCTQRGGMLHCALDLFPVHTLARLQVYNLSDFGGYEVYSVVPEHLLISVGFVPRMPG